MEQQIFQQRTDLTTLNNAVSSIRNEIKKIIVGQDEMVKLIIAALLADGHVALVTGEAFGDANCIRISYAASEKELTEAMTRIKNSLAKLS